MNRLVIYKGDELLAEHEIARAVIGLGRHPENDIVLDDRTLSRFHARIEKRANSYVVVDLGAQNGVHKNGLRIEKESALESGDRIELGRYVAVFEVLSKATKVERPPGQNGAANGAAGNGHKGPPAATPVKAKSGKPTPAQPEADLDVDVNLDDDDDLDFPNAETSRTKPPEAKRKDDDDNDNTGSNDFDAAASSVEYVPPKPTFVLLFNGMEVSRHPLTSSGITVGRSKQCEVVISLLGLSRKHAKINASDDGVVVEDLGSQNGTWVNNQRIEGSRVLRHGDLLNFYDYGVLFLEDGDVEVGFPGADFKQAPTTDERARGVPDDLSSRKTDQGSVPSVAAARPRQATVRSPLTDHRDEPQGEETERGRGRPPKAKKKGAVDDDPSRLDLDDLGEGSFLGDEFDDGASKEHRPRPAAPSDAMGTELIEGVDVGPGDEDLEAEMAFAASAAAAAEPGRKPDRKAEAQGPGGSWPGDEELEKVLALSHAVVALTLDVTLKGKAYAQIPLNQAITRVGADARCEVALPKSAGLRPWHCTLLHSGGAVLVQRTNRSASIEVAGKEVDVAVLKNHDVVKMGNVEIKLRFRKA